MYSFKEIVGLGQIVRSLQNAVRYNRVSHAYIFSGEAGMGKKLLAKTYAKTLECETGGIEPCGHCRSCLTFESGNHPDIFYVLPSKTKAIGVDDIREQVSENLLTKPFSSRYKIFIIDNADTMTVQAQNALLKSIEEPMGFAVFFLLSQNLNLFLPTVRSRCVCYKLKPVPEPDVLAYLLRTGSTAKNAEFLASYASGNIGHALRLAEDTEFVAMRDDIISVAQALNHSDLVQVFACFQTFDKYKERIQEALNILYVWYRDVLAYLTTGKEHLVQGALARQIAEEPYDSRSLLRFLDAVYQAKQQLKQYANFQLTIEVMLLNLAKE